MLVRNGVRILQQSRNMSVVICGPPSIHLTLTEKIAHGAFIIFSCLATPAWVLRHMLVYRRLK